MERGGRCLTRPLHFIRRIVLISQHIASHHIASHSLGSISGFGAVQSERGGDRIE